MQKSQLPSVKFDHPQIKKANRELMRKIKVGTILRCYYDDSETPRLELVVEDPAATESIWCVQTISLNWFNQDRRRCSWNSVTAQASPRGMNTDKVEIVGYLTADHIMSSIIQ